MIELICPQCGAVLNIPEQYLGQSGTCRHCNARVIAAPPKKPNLVLKIAFSTTVTLVAISLFFVYAFVVSTTETAEQIQETVTPSTPTDETPADYAKPEAGEVDQPVINGSVQGRVLVKETGDGVPNVQVAIHDVYSTDTDTPAYIVETDDSGNYSAKDIVPGAYKIQVESPIPYLADTRRVVVQNASRISGANLELSAPLSVSGIVVDETDSQLADVKLSFEPMDIKTTPIATSDQRGRFELFAYPVGQEMTLRAEARGKVAVQRPLMLGNDPIRDVRLVMRPGATLSGELLYPTGAPASDIVLYLRKSDTSEGRYRSVRTQEDGHFTLDMLEPGDFDLFRFVWGEGEDDSEFLAKIRLAEGEILADQRYTTSVTDPAHSVSGRVIDDTGEPIQDVLVRVPKGSNRVVLTRTNDNGEFIASPLRPGEHEIEFWMSGYRKIETEAPADSTGIDVTLERFSGFRGDVIDARTRLPVERFEINAGEDVLGLFWMKDYFLYQDEQGRFTSFFLHPNSSPRIIFRAEGYAQQEMRIGPANPGEMLSGIQVELTPERPIAGKVLSPEGHILSEAEIIVGNPEDPRRSDMGYFRYMPNDSFARKRYVQSSPETITDEDGHFVIRGKADGDIRLTVRHPDGAPTPFVFARGDDMSKLELKMDSSLSIRGTVIMDGQPLPHAAVDLRLEPRNVDLKEDFYLNATADENGQYVLTGLPRGSGELNLDHENREENRNLYKEIRVALNTPTIVDINFATSTTSVQGVLRDSSGIGVQGTVRIDVVGENLREERTYKTDETGSFQFDSLISGQAKLTAFGKNVNRPKPVELQIVNNRSYTQDVGMYKGYRFQYTFSNIKPNEIGRALILPADVEIPDTITGLIFHELASQAVAQGETWRAVDEGTITFEELEKGFYKVLGVKYPRTRIEAIPDGEIRSNIKDLEITGVTLQFQSVHF